MDTYLDLNTTDLFGRVDSRVDKEALIADIAKDYALGRVRSMKRIPEGFEDCNLKVQTSRGKYLVKLFSQFKSFRQVKDNVRGLQAAFDAGVRVPKVLKTKSGRSLYCYERGDVMALGCIMDYFEGKSFFSLQAEPGISDIKSIVEDIAKFNSVDFKPKGIYDVWVVQNLPDEFDKKKSYLSKKALKLTVPIVEKVRKVDYGKCTKGTIHNDIQRSNVLKSQKGKICLIDFSVIEYNAISIELATFISLFCINPFKDSASEMKRKYDLVIGEYQKYKGLSSYDLKILPDLVLGTYAANCLAASFELRGKGNDSEETRYWVDLGREGMAKLIKLLGK